MTIRQLLPLVAAIALALPVSSQSIRDRAKASAPAAKAAPAAAPVAVPKVKYKKARKARKKAYQGVYGGYAAKPKGVRASVSDKTISSSDNCFIPSDVPYGPGDPSWSDRQDGYYCFVSEDCNYYNRTLIYIHEGNAEAIVHEISPYTRNNNIVVYYCTPLPDDGILRMEVNPRLSEFHRSTHLVFDLNDNTRRYLYDSTPPTSWSHMRRIYPSQERLKEVYDIVVNQEDHRFDRSLWHPRTR